MPDPTPMSEQELHRKLRELGKKLGIEHKEAPGANDQELYPTDEGRVEFRIAKGKRRSGGGNYA